jgi:hypothetical protein
MTTIERAKRFHERIEEWSGYTIPSHPNRHWGEFEEWIVAAMWCQFHVARALIRQDTDNARRKYLTEMRNQYNAGYLDGLFHALKILDAVYGRKK